MESPSNPSGLDNPVRAANNEKIRKLSIYASAPKKEKKYSEKSFTIKKLTNMAGENRVNRVVIIPVSEPKKFLKNL